MSDDSHGVEQVGTNYARLLAFIQKAEIAEIHFVNSGGVRMDERFPSAGFSSIATSTLAASSFWTNLR
jgi:histidinol-phosphatase (PHP family)